MTAADVGDLELTARATSTGTGFTHLRYARSDRGIPAFDGGLRASLDRGGRILSVTAAPEAPQVESAIPRLGAAAALRALQRAVGVERAVDVVAGPDGVRRMTRFEGGDFARLVLYGSGRGTRLAWHLTYRASEHAHYDAVVAADDGAILFRQNLSKDAAVADVYESHPAEGAQITVDLQQRGWLASGAGTLDGPYAHAYSDLDDDDGPSPGEEVQRLNGHFQFPFIEFSPRTCNGDVLCSWDGSNGSWEANRERNAVQAFYLVNRFRDHLAQPPISFNAFAGADKVRVETTDGAATGPDDEHLNNASMTTLPEGLPPLMQLYLFRGDGFRTVHGGDSAAVVWHEYAHGLSNRLVVHDDGSGALSSAQAGAMGEGWSDWYALDLLVDDDLLADEPRARRGRPRRLSRLRAPHAADPGARLPGRAGLARLSRRRLHVRGLRPHRRWPPGARRRRDLGRDAVGSADRGRLRDRPGADHRGDADVAARALVPGHAQLDPGRRGRAPRQSSQCDLDRVRQARDGLPGAHATAPPTSPRPRTSACRRRPARRAGGPPAPSPRSRAAWRWRM